MSAFETSQDRVLGYRPYTRVARAGKLKAFNERFGNLPPLPEGALTPPVRS
jgi:hypothetical protein